MELWEIQEYVIKPQLRTVPGVAEVNAYGGYVKQIVVQPKIDKLRDAGLTVNDLAQNRRRKRREYRRRHRQCRQRTTRYPRGRPSRFAAGDRRAAGEIRRRRSCHCASKISPKSRLVTHFAPARRHMVARRPCSAWR